MTRLLWCRAYDTGQWFAHKDVAIQVPILVDAEVAATARARLATYKTRGLKRTLHVYLLEGIATCGVCKAPIRIHGYAKKKLNHTYAYHYYTCDRVRYPLISGKCTLKAVRTDIADAKIWARVVECLIAPSLLHEAIKRNGAVAADRRHAVDDLADWRKRLDALPDLETEALRMRERGLLSVAALEIRLRDTTRRREMLELQISTAEAMANSVDITSVNATEIEEAIEMLRREAAAASDEGRKKIVQVLCGTWEIGADGEIRGEVSAKAATVAVQALRGQVQKKTTVGGLS